MASGRIPSSCPGSTSWCARRWTGAAWSARIRSSRRTAAGRRLTIGVRRKPEGLLTPWLLRRGEAGAGCPVEVSVPGGPGLVLPRHAFRGVPCRRCRRDAGRGDGQRAGAAAHDAPRLQRARRRRRRLPAQSSRPGAGTHAGFSYALRETRRTGRSRRATSPRWCCAIPARKFYLCGPQGYVERCIAHCGAPRVEPRRIHVEQFALSPVAAPARSPRARAYAAGVLLSVLPPLLLLPALAGPAAARPSQRRPRATALRGLPRRSRRRPCARPCRRRQSMPSACARPARCWACSR